MTDWKKKLKDKISNALQKLGLYILSDKEVDAYNHALLNKAVTETPETSEFTNTFQQISKETGEPYLTRVPMVRGLKDSHPEFYALAGGTGLARAGLKSTVGEGLNLMGRTFTPSAWAEGALQLTPKAASKILPITKTYVDPAVHSLFLADATARIGQKTFDGTLGDNPAQDALDVSMIIGPVASILGTKIQGVNKGANFLYKTFKPVKSFNNVGASSTKNTNLIGRENLSNTVPVYPNTPSNTSAPSSIELLPGFLLKGFMRGNPLEKLLSENNTISVNSVIAHTKKQNKLTQEIVNEVLQEDFPGQNRINYNDLRKAIQKRLISYTTTPSRNYEDYGVVSLGFRNMPKFNTFTFSSPKIPYGNAEHYSVNTLGHSRTYTTKEEPEVLHVMESQSDWALNYRKWDPEKLQKRLALREREVLELRTILERGVNLDGQPLHEWEKQQILELLEHAQEKLANVVSHYPLLHHDYLKANYELRLMLENLRYAAEHGLTKMRYPTPDTAAKIEGYNKTELTYPPGILERIKTLQRELENLTFSAEEIKLLLDRTKLVERVFMLGRLSEMGALQELDRKLASYGIDLEGFKSLTPEAKALQNEIDKLSGSAYLDYDSSSKTILKKYADFPKMFEKLYGKGTVRNITDNHGNTWWEVNVPKNFLNSEWLYKQGGKLNYLKFFKRVP